VRVESAPETATIKGLREGAFDSLFEVNAGIPEIIREAEEAPQHPPSVALVSATPFLPISPEMPLYSPIANAARQEGRVSFTFDVSSDGKVENAVIVSGNKLLSYSVVETVSKWKFPLEANGHSGQGILEFRLNCQNVVRTSVN
jgi:TonB family protein